MLKRIVAKLHLKLKEIAERSKKKINFENYSYSQIQNFNKNDDWDL